MEYTEQEEWIDKLLVFMYKNFRKQGGGYISFDLREDGVLIKQLLEKFSTLSKNEIFEVIDSCLADRYIKDEFSEQYFCILLTENGKARAKSVLAAEHAKPEQIIPSHITTIGMINSSAPLQIGDGNVQNVTQVFNDIVKDIDDADASEDEKKEAKGLLSKFLEHPLAGTVVGLSVEAAKSICGGA
jgi:hypothetical protein